MKKRNVGIVQENNASWAQVREFNLILFTRAGHCMAITLLELDRLTYI